MHTAIEKAIASFRRAADTKAEGLGGRADRREYERMAAAYHELLARGPDGRAALRTLLSDSSPHVRSWIAAALLHDGEAAARPVLETLATSGGLTGISAEMALQQFDAGTLGPPFPRRGA